MNTAWKIIVVVIVLGVVLISIAALLRTLAPYSTALNTGHRAYDVCQGFCFGAGEKLVQIRRTSDGGFECVCEPRELR